MLNALYLALEDKLHLQYGKVLLATASLSQLQSMLAKGWPYFTSYFEDIDKCLNGSDCQGVVDHLLTLGK